jgi:fructokinase
MTLFGGIEAGGTKFVCAVGTGPGDLHKRTSFPTTTPAATIAQALAFFKQQPEMVAAIGIGAFGPVDPNPASPTYGYITSTPKLAWQNTDIRGAIARGLGVPVGFDTDVNVAAIGEHRWGASQDVDSSLYITVGTGIGGGVLVDGKPLHGALHPEIGHILVRRDPAADPFAGICPFHGDCLEGLASGPAVGARWQAPAQTLPPEHPAWPLEARYLALGLVSCIYVLSPERIILGGGIMQQAQLFPLIRAQVQQQLNGYLKYPAVQEAIDSYIVPPGLGGAAGVLGAIALAEQTHRFVNA